MIAVAGTKKKKTNRYKDAESLPQSAWKCIYVHIYGMRM